VSHAGPILVVEDDEGIRSTILDLLKYSGYPVVTAEDGASALELVARGPVGLILLDLKMPVMDGWAFVRAYRRQAVQPAPIVVITAAPDAARWAAEIEATAHLAKPFELADLLAVVERYAAPA
jgi:CheY-like chemotaxis protein